MRLLILGGTAEARQLAQQLAGRPGLEVTLSLAGRTTAPAAVPVPVRIGGFGGARGLADYLAAERIDALIDATHPYAAVMSRNATQAAKLAAVRFVALRRTPWIPRDGDRWIEVVNIAAAVLALGDVPRQVFLALGRKELTPFAAAPQHRYVIRSVEPVDPPLALPRAEYLTARGPFREADEHALLLAHKIEIIVAKNSGGSASYGKIAAARALGLTVVMLRRPQLPPAPSVETVQDAVAWLDHGSLPCAERGV